MVILIKMALDAIYVSFGENLRIWLLNLFSNAMGWINSLSANFFDSTVVSATYDFAHWLSWLVLGGAILFTFLDIAEDLANVKPGQPIEWCTILLNFVKAVAFVEIAPVLSRETIIVGLSMIREFQPDSSLDYATALPELLPLLFAVICLIAFFGMSVASVGEIALLGITVFLYVPDIVRGRTTSLGDWTRQCIAVLVTFLFRSILFYIGLVATVNNDILSMATAWLAMISASRILQKFGMSTGFGGVAQNTLQIGQSAAYTIMSIVR